MPQSFQKEEKSQES